MQCINKLIVSLLVIPVIVRELIDTVTDTQLFQANVNLVNKIISYPGAINKQLPMRAIDAPWLCQAAAVFFIVFHIAMALILAASLVYWYRNHKSAWLQLSLVIYMVLYVVLFAIIVDDYFMAMVQGIDYTLPILGSIILPLITLFYLRTEK